MWTCVSTKGVIPETTTNCTLTAVGHHLFLFGGAIISDKGRGRVGNNLYVMDIGTLREN